MARRVVDDEGRLQSPTIARRANGEPVQIPTPTLSEMKSLTDGELFEVVRQFSILSDWPQLVGEAQSVVTQLASIPQSAANYEDLVDQVVQNFAADGNKRVILGMARDSVRGFLNESVRSDSPPDATFIRISEGDEHVCERCDELAGAIGTYGQHAAEGLPGVSSCLGGSYCRCVLVEID